MPLDNADAITGNTSTPPGTHAVPEGFDPDRWALLKIRMSAPVPALASSQATELLWQLLRRTAPGDRQNLKDALDFIGVPFDSVYLPTAAEAGGSLAETPVVDVAIPAYPGDDSNWVVPLNREAELDWWAP